MTWKPPFWKRPARAGRQLYVQAFAALQDSWLAAHRHRFSAQRWRTLHWLTPFGPVDLPVRVVREKASGRYLTLSKVLLRHKATRLLSPALEQEACAAATEQNYRPAARTLSRWIGVRLNPWLVWAAVQFHGARLLLEQEKTPPPPARPMNVPALISEVDSTWLKASNAGVKARCGISKCIWACTTPAVRAGIRPAARPASGSPTNTS